MITENNINNIKPVDKREISSRLISNVLLSMASLLEVTGWVAGIATDQYGRPTPELDLSKALWQVVHGSYGSREGLWHATRGVLLEQIGKGCTCLAKWNDKQKSASDVIELCRTAEHSIQSDLASRKAMDEYNPCTQSADFT